MDIRNHHVGPFDSSAIIKSSAETMNLHSFRKKGEQNCI